MAFSAMEIDDQFLMEDSKFTAFSAMTSSTASDDPFMYFEDYFPSMVERLGADGFMGELCSGFILLMDVEKGLITFESLKRNTFLLGLNDLRDEELLSMLAEGDLDGDGALNQLEFCILMFRLSPGLMDGSKLWMQEIHALKNGINF